MQGPPSTKHTPGRHKWLRRLADHPGTTRSGRGACGYSCMVLGWTTWQDPAVCRGEVITDTGRATLEAWDAAAKLAPQSTKRPNLPTPAHHRQRKPAKRNPARQTQGADTQLLDALEANGWALRHSSLWEVILAFGKVERVLGYGRTVRQAIQAAIIAGKALTPDTQLPAPEPQTLAEAVLEAVTTGVELPRADLGEEVGATWSRSPVNSLGQWNPPPRQPSYQDCPACNGKGSTGHHQVCRGCMGAGKVARTVEA